MGRIRIETDPPLRDLERELRAYYSEVRTGRYLCDRRLAPDAAVQYEMERLEAYSKDAGVLLAVGPGGRVLGLLGYHFSKWDSDLLKKRVAIVRHFTVAEQNLYENMEAAQHLLHRFHLWVSDQKIDTVIMRLDTNVQTTVHIAQQEQYQFYECANYLTLDELPEDVIGGSRERGRLATEADVPILQEMAAKQFFRRSHFFLDPRFTVCQAESVYATWIEAAIGRGEPVFLYEEDGAVRGMFLYEMLDMGSRFQKKYGVWKMAVLDSRARGRGSGWQLFYGAIAQCKGAGADAIDSSYVVHNISSYNIHSKLGFRLICATYTFHRWFR